MAAVGHVANIEASAVDVLSMEALSGDSKGEEEESRSRECAMQ